MTRASISITPPNDAWIKSQIESEEFSSRSEVVNDLIRKARQEQAEILDIRAALIEGEESGAPQPFDRDAFKQEMIAKHGKEHA